MATYSVSDAKNQLSALLAKVRKGARVVITRRGVAVAVLVPPERAEGLGAAGEGRLADLDRAGLVVRRRGTLTATLLKPPVAAAGGASAVAALLAERADDR